VIGKQWEITGTGVLRAEYFLTAIQQRQRILPGFTTISEGDVLDFLVAKNKEKHSDTQDQLQFFYSFTDVQCNESQMNEPAVRVAK